jgi:septation ring formation regulator EzrA
LKKERASLDEVRGQLRKADSEVKLSLSQFSTLKAELDQVRATATALSQDYGKIGETSREARDGTAAALATAKDVERRLGPLTRLLEMSKSADERLRRSADLPSTSHSTPKRSKASSRQWNTPSYKPIA